MEFLTFHRYQTLVRRDQAPALVCPCGAEVYLQSYLNVPALKCYMCGALTIPGQNLYDDLKKIVDEFFHG